LGNIARGEGDFVRTPQQPQQLPGRFRSVPNSALLVNRHAACFDLGDHGDTFSGNARLCAVENDLAGFTVVFKFG
jgi:hypothetical protein